jgi:hypothetical protein
MAAKDLLCQAPKSDLAWDMEHRDASLQTVVTQVTTEARDAIGWYVNAKRIKQRWAKGLRVLAILLVAAAGLIPMLADLTGMSPVWATVALGIAAALIALDRFFGFSTAWIRYISTELELQHLLADFGMEWEAMRASWGGRSPTDEQIQVALAACRVLRGRVHDLVRQETSRWVAEFQDTLKLLDEAVKAKEQAAARGGVNVTVANGDRCSRGWDLSIDGGPARSCSGKSAAVTGLVPGSHTVSVDGEIEGHLRRAERAVDVPANGLATVELTLG